MKKNANGVLSAKLILFIFGIILIQTAKAQTLQTYSGVYKLTYPSFVNGTATYTYYENPDTYERVREGKFKFTYELPKNKIGTSKTIIEGVYKNNLKHGQWIYTIESKDLKSENSYWTGVIKLVANYRNGMPDGPWSSSIGGKSRKIQYNLNKIQYEFGDWRGESKAKIVANFTKGMLTGKINYTKFDKQVGEHSTVDLTLDKDGFFTDKLIIDSGSTKYINEFENGFLFRTTGVNTQNGNVNTNDYSDDLLLVKQLQKIKIRDPSELENLDFKLVEATFSNRFLELIIAEHFFNNDLFHFEDIKGDVYFKDRNYRYEGFKTYVLKRQVSKVVVEKFKELTVLMNDMGKFRKLLTSEDSKVIDESNGLISMLDRYYLGKYDEYRTYENSEKLKGYQRLQKDEEFFRNIPENEALDKVIIEVTQNHDLLKNIVDEGFRDYLVRASKLVEDGKYDNAKNMYTTALNFNLDNDLVKHKLVELEQHKEGVRVLSKQTSDMSNYSYIIKQNKQIIEEMYTVEDRVGSLIGNSLKVKKKKKRLYTAFEILQHDYLTQIDEANNLNVKEEKSKLLIKLYSLMYSLSNANTKQLEKELKDQTNPEVIQQILGLDEKLKL